MKIEGDKMGLMKIVCVCGGGAYLTGLAQGRKPFSELPSLLI